MWAHRFAARIALAIGLAAAVASTSVLARDWSADRLRGTVLILEGDEWRELERGEIVSSESAIRTLQSGHLELRSSGELVRVGPQTVFELFTSPGGSSTLLKQYSGTIVIEAHGLSALKVDAFDLTIVPISGAVTIKIDDERPEISVIDGHASVTDRSSGKTVQIASSDAVGSSSGVGPAITPSGDSSSSGSASSGGSSAGGKGSGGGSGGASSGNASSGNNNASSGNNNASSGNNNGSGGANNASSGNGNGNSNGGSGGA